MNTILAQIKGWLNSRPLSVSLSKFGVRYIKGEIIKTTSNCIRCEVQKFVGVQLNTRHVGIILRSFSDTDCFGNHNQSPAMTGTSVLIYIKCRPSIHTSGCGAYLTPLAQLKGTASKLYSTIPRSIPKGVLSSIWASRNSPTWERHSLIHHVRVKGYSDLVFSRWAE